MIAHGAINRTMHSPHGFGLIQVKTGGIQGL